MIALILAVLIALLLLPLAIVVACNVIAAIVTGIVYPFALIIGTAIRIRDGLLRRNNLTINVPCGTTVTDSSREVPKS